MVVGAASMLAVCAGLLGTGCAGQDEAAPSDQPTQAPVIAAPAEEQTVSVPQVFFEGVWESDPMTVLQDFGGADITKEDDGSYTVTFSADGYAGFVERVYADAKAAIDDVASSGLHPHVTAVDYDEQFATVTVTLDTTNLSAVETRLPAGGRPSGPVRRDPGGPRRLEPPGDPVPQRPGQRRGGKILERFE